MAECQPKLVGLAKFSIPTAASLSDFDKAQRDRFPDPRRYRVAVNAVGDEVLISHRQLAIIVAAMGCESAQGYYFARPMPAARVEDILASNGRRGLRLPEFASA